ncbi:MAG: dihydropteroate synthase [Clostridiales bacterium]|nr:dihydropteroate synthase [Clostridiales bacterium]
MKIGNRNFQTSSHTYVMGILNVTPDSFSDGGRWNAPDQALAHAEEMVRQGADVIDIGGESTRPGYTRLSEQEEIDRVVPVIEAVKARFDVPVSLDTYKSRVAQAGLTAGADLVNDIWGLKYDPDMAGVIARADVPCCLMHNRETADYGMFMVDLLKDMTETLSLARAAGIRDERIILDPGVGFGKRYEHNLEVIDRLEELNGLGYPVLLGASRKSVIGLTLDLPTDQRLEGTLVTTVFAVLKDCMFVRVHDVESNVRAIRMTEALRRGY